MGAFIDLTGRLFGKLVVLSRSDRTNARGDVHWNCLCECGSESVASGRNLKSGCTRSCGCFKRERSRDSHTKHGKHGTRVYRIWKNMIQRCESQGLPCYLGWGARGITVCEAWRNNFADFYDWAIANGYQDSLSIDRIDNDRGYSPDNCRWATRETQSRNRRLQKSNKSGVNGVYWKKSIGKWEASIGVAKKHVHLGYYDSIEAAAESRKKAEEQYWEVG